MNRGNRRMPFLTHTIMDTQNTNPINEDQQIPATPSVTEDVKKEVVPTEEQTVQEPEQAAPVSETTTPEEK